MSISRSEKNYVLEWFPFFSLQKNSRSLTHRSKILFLGQKIE